MSTHAIASRISEVSRDFGRNICYGFAKISVRSFKKIAGMSYGMDTLLLPTSSITFTNGSVNSVSDICEYLTVVPIERSLNKDCQCFLHRSF